MANLNLGACEWFVWDLRRSHLLENEMLDQVVAAFLMQQPQGEPPALAQHMVEQKLLTPFQAERLLQGKSHDLVLGPYVLQEAVGTGSMGTVYRAISNKDHKPYAVKVLPRRSTWNARMARRQVTTFEKCKHPAVVPFVDVGTAGATHYLTWPFVQGESLQKLVEREGKLESQRAARFALQAAEGLQVCHQNGLIHGMIKPSNLLLTADQQIRILDFGVGALLAQSEEESLVDTRSTANVLASGLDCVSPESILDPTQRTAAGDQYSLGCVLYYCLAGRLPFEGSAAEKLQAHRSQQPEPIRDLNPAVPEALAAVVNRLMQKTPADRYADMKEVADALRSVADPMAAFLAPSAVPSVSAASMNSSPATFSTDQAVPSQSVEQEPARMQPIPTLPIEVVPQLSAVNQIAASSINQEDKPPAPADTPAPRKSATPTPPELSLTPVAVLAATEAPKTDKPIAVSPPDKPIAVSPPDKPAAVSPPDKPAAVSPADQTPPKPAAEKETPRKQAMPVPKPAPLPPGTTKVLGRAPGRAPSDYSVFDLPAVNDPRAPRLSSVQKAPVALPAEVESAPQKAAASTPEPKAPAPSSPEKAIPVPDAAPAKDASRPIQQSGEQSLSLDERLGPRTMMVLALFVAVVVFLIGYMLIPH